MGGKWLLMEAFPLHLYKSPPPHPQSFPYSLFKVNSFLPSEYLYLTLYYYSVHVILNY